MLSVLCAGEALVDFISDNTGFSISDSSGFKKEAGGAPFNTACTINHLGGRAWFAGAVGDDSFGRYLLYFLTRYGVDKSFVQVNKEFATTMAFVSLMNDGERDFEFVRGADREFAVQKEDYEKYIKRDIFHFGSATAFLGGKLEVSYKEIFNIALAEKKIISFDPNYRSMFYQNNHEGFRNNISDFMNKASLIKLSKEELRIITQQADIEAGVNILYEKNPALYCITLGKDGTYVKNKSVSRVIPSIKVVPVDTTGAGDAFVGALLYRISQKDDALSFIQSEELTEDVAFANKIGADVTTRKGALSSLSSPYGRFLHVKNG